MLSLSRRHGTPKAACAIGAAALAALLATGARAQDRYVDRAPPEGNVYQSGHTGIGGSAPAAFIQGNAVVLPTTALPYGPGKTDEIGGAYYTAYYDPPSAAGLGVATWWDDNETASGVSANGAGLFCSLPMLYSGPGAEGYKQDVNGTPIPEYPFGTLVRVTNAHTGAWVVCAITDRGPALWTGAAIDLSTDAKIHLGMTPGNSGVNGLVYYEIVRDAFDSTFQSVMPIQ